MLLLVLLVLMLLLLLPLLLLLLMLLIFAALETHHDHIQVCHSCRCTARSGAPAQSPWIQADAAA